jgi:bacterioferritin-associated ferredoxin
MYVCLCHAVTEAEVLDAVAAGAHSEEAVAETTHAGTGCAGCLERLGDLLDEAAPYGCRLRALPRTA